MFQCGVTKTECSFSSYCKHLAMWPSLLSYYKSKNGFAAPVVYSSSATNLIWNITPYEINTYRVKLLSVFFSFFFQTTQKQKDCSFYFQSTLSTVRYWCNREIRIFFHSHIQSNCTNTIPWSSWKRANKTAKSTRKMSQFGWRQIFKFNLTKWSFMSRLTAIFPMFNIAPKIISLRRLPLCNSFSLNGLDMLESI